MSRDSGWRRPAAGHIGPPARRVLWPRLAPGSRILLALALALGLGPAGCRLQAYPAGGGPPAGARALHRSVVSLGTSWDLTVAAGRDAEAAGLAALDQAVAELARVQSVAGSGSSVDQVNLAAGGRDPVPVEPLAAELVRAGLRVAYASRGAFDPTAGPLRRLWERTGDRPPERAPLARALGRIGYSRVELDPQAATLRLPEPLMELELEALARGAAAELALAALRGPGLAGAWVASREVHAAWGVDPAGAAWTASVSLRAGAPPAAIPLADGRVLAVCPLRDPGAGGGAGGRLPLLDPRTGYPARNPAGAAVLAPDGPTACALAEAAAVLGAEAGLALAGSGGTIDLCLVPAEGPARFSAGFPSCPGV